MSDELRPEFEPAQWDVPGWDWAPEDGEPQPSSYEEARHWPTMPEDLDLREVWRGGREDTGAERGDWLASMDPGIAPFVSVLDAYGVETYESCQCGGGHSYPEPAIRFHGQRAAGFHALAVALDHGLPVRAIRRIWTVDKSGEPHGPNWEIVFWRTAQSDDVNEEWLGGEMDMQARAFARRVETVRPACAKENGE